MVFESFPDFRLRWGYLMVVVVVVVVVEVAAVASEQEVA